MRLAFGLEKRALSREAVYELKAQRCSAVGVVIAPAARGASHFHLPIKTPFLPPPLWASLGDERRRLHQVSRSKVKWSKLASLLDVPTIEPPGERVCECSDWAA